MAGAGNSSGGIPVRLGFLGISWDLVRRSFRRAVGIRAPKAPTEIDSVFSDHSSRIFGRFRAFWTKLVVFGRTQAV